MIKIAVAGAAGRMGRRITANICADPETELSGALEAPDSPALGKDACELVGCKVFGIPISSDAKKVVVGCDVLIAFTLPEGTLPILEAAVAVRKPIVIGTTGHSEVQQKKIAALAKKTAVVMAANMSVGVNVMWKLVALAARALGTGFQVGVSETHHIHKQDKPSGTAKEIVRIVSETLAIKPESIPCESIRQREVIGDHTTIFQTPDEMLAITHHAETRDLFAQGALRAAKWIVGKTAGLYNMQDVLQLKT